MLDKTELSHLFGKLSVVAGMISIVLNTILLYLIVYESPKNFGAYKRLMFTISAFEILYSMVDMLLAPVHFAQESVIIVLSEVDNTPLGRQVVLVLCAFYWGFFGASLAIFAVLFIYRYLVIKGHLLVSTFNTWKIVLWLSIPLFFALSLAFTGRIFSHPRPETSEFIREKFFEMFGRSIDDFEYLGLHLYDTENGRIVRYHTDSLFSSAVLSISTAFSFCTVIFFGVKCYKCLTKLLKSSSSQHHKDLQWQLFCALVFQTLVPVVLMHIPEATVLLVTLLNIDIGPYCLILSATVTFFPAIDPISNFLIIKPYRNAVLSRLLEMQKRKRKQRNTNHSAITRFQLLKIKPLPDFESWTLRVVKT